MRFGGSGREPSRKREVLAAVPCTGWAKSHACELHKVYSKSTLFDINIMRKLEMITTSIFAQIQAAENVVEHLMESCS